MSQRLQMFAIFDKKAQAYIAPHFFPQAGEAIREFEDQINKTESMLFRHPEDFVLASIGEWDNKTGVITPLTAPILIQEAINLKAPQNK